MQPPRILTVCTANICRSPATAVLLQWALGPLPLDVEITSAGTMADDGRPACDLSAALVGQYAATHGVQGRTDGHRSRRVTRADLEHADLILALDRSHRAELAKLHPGSRPRTFTLRQAAAAAAAVTDSLARGELPPQAPPIPDGAGQRFTWWIEELDAARAYTVGEPAPVSRAPVIDPLDVPDPHVVGYQYHPVAMDLITAAVQALADSLAVVDRFGAPDQRPHNA